MSGWYDSSGGFDFNPFKSNTTGTDSFDPHVGGAPVDKLSQKLNPFSPTATGQFNPFGPKGGGGGGGGGGVGGGSISHAPGVDAGAVGTVDASGAGGASYANNLGIQRYAIGSLPGSSSGLNSAAGAGAMRSMNYLQGIADGTQVNPAAVAAQQAQGQALASQMAAANSSRGFYNGSNMRSAMEAGGNAQAQIASNGVGQIAATRAAAAQGAGQLGQGLATMDQQNNQFNSDLGFRIGAANQQSGNAYNQSLLGGGGLYNQSQGANVQTDLDIQKLIQSGALGNGQLDVSALGSRNAMYGGILNGIGTGAAYAGMGKLVGGGTAAAGAGGLTTTMGNAASDGAAGDVLTTAGTGAVALTDPRSTMNNPGAPGGLPRRPAYSLY